MTNREKFTEIFGCEIAQHDNGEAIPGHCKILIASDRHFNDWLKQEYVPSAQPSVSKTEIIGDAISRQAAITEFSRCELTPDGGIDANYAIDFLKQMPPVDAVPVVRCKDCKFGEQDEVGRWFCRSLGCQIGNEDGSGFCADAERRTDE